jgi:hypothetical protein
LPKTADIATQAQITSAVSFFIAFCPVSCYIVLMDVIVEFNESAFRHKICREDILCALKTKIRAGAVGGLPEKYAVIGFDRAGNPLELMY